MALFLAAAVGLVVLQNLLGAGLAAVLGVHPLIGVAAGSISLTGGHGTSAAFGPLLEQAGAAGALPAAIAAATYGLVSGCVIGGPLGTLLMRRNGLRPAGSAAGAAPAVSMLPTSASASTGDTVMYASILITVCIGAGTLLVNWLKGMGITPVSYTHLTLPTNREV